MKKQEVKNFYDTKGWKYDGENSHDAVINENLTRVAGEYVSKVRRRILSSLGSGHALLDIGCGPIQYPEYVEYSMNFEKRVCVDLSKEALILAKEKIGTHGRFIVGDYLQLQPLEETPFAGATLINVLYHVEKSKQAVLVRRILGDISPGAKLVVVYSNPRTFSALVTKLLVKVKHSAMRFTPGGERQSLDNPIYFFRFPLGFWNQFGDEAKITKSTWRTFSPALEKLIFRKSFFGKFFLKILFKLEEMRLWVHVAEYTIVVLQKI
jgi:ubiquinone/menaquinone biosynthesis C-methylase UbiE